MLQLAICTTKGVCVYVFLQVLRGHMWAGSGLRLPLPHSHDGPETTWGVTLALCLLPQSSDSVGGRQPSWAVLYVATSFHVVLFSSTRFLSLSHSLCVKRLVPLGSGFVHWVAVRTFFDRGFSFVIYRRWSLKFG